MLEEEDGETSQDVDLNLLDKIMEECSKFKKKLKTTVDIARRENERQNDRIKYLLDENIRLKSIISEMSDSGNTPQGMSVSQSNMEPCLLSNNLVVMKECCEGVTLTGSGKIGFTEEGEAENTMMRKGPISGASDELDTGKKTNEVLTYIASGQSRLLNMLEEVDGETPQENDLNLLDEIMEECSKFNKRLKTAVDIARRENERQNQRIKYLLDENIRLKSIITEMSDSGNTPQGTSVSQSNMEPCMLLNNLVVMEEGCQGDAHTGSGKTEFTEAEGKNTMMRKGLTSTGIDELDIKEGTSEVLAYIASGQSRSSKVENNQKRPATATNLPTEILQKIFKYLSYDDLRNVQNICTKWNLATEDTLVWKYAPLKLDKDYNLEELANVPYLHTVIGETSDMEKLFQSLANNVIDLRKFHCCVHYTKEYEVISLEIFKNFLDTFKNLEFIYFPSSIPNIFELLEAASTHLNIKSLVLETGEPGENIPNVGNICRIFHTGFLALTKFVTWSCDRTPLANELPKICKIKLNQLTELEFRVHDNADFEAWKFVFKSEKLESLCIIADEQIEEALDMNLSRMTALKYLALNYQNDTEMVYKTLLYPQNVEYLKLNFISSPKDSTGIVSKAISSLPGLRVLYIKSIDDSNLDQQLEKIYCLPTLHTLSINHCEGLSVSGVETVLMKCAVLQKFAVSGVSFRDKTYECLKNSKYLGDIKLTKCILNPYKLVIIISSMKNLTNVRMKFCKFRNEEGEKVAITEEVINNIVKERKFEKPYAKISFLKKKYFIGDRMIMVDVEW